MKASNIKWSPLQIIYGLAIINSLALIFIGGWATSPDSATYVQAWDVFLSGDIDQWRTPVYPFFLGILQSMAGKEHLYFATICVQHLLFLVSIRYFHWMTKQICHNPKTVFWITLFYALHPGIASWSSMILTEILAVIASVFLIYCSLKVWKVASFKACFGFTFWLLFLVFLRPAFVYMLPVSLVAWGIAVFKRKEVRKASLTCIGGTLLVTCCLLSYMKAFEQRYGVFTPSGISTLNQYYIARQNGMLNPQLIKHPGLKAYLEKSISEKGQSSDVHAELWAEANEAIEIYGLKEVQEAVSVSNKSNPIGWAKKVGGRIYRAVQLSLFVTYFWGPIATLVDMVDVNMNTLYLFLLIYTGVLFYYIFKRRKLPWLSCLFYMLGCSNLIVAIVGAQAEWSRLVIPSLPIYLLMAGQLLNLIKISKFSVCELE